MLVSVYLSCVLQYYTVYADVGQYMSGCTMYTQFSLCESCVWGGCQVRACMIRKCYTACEHVSVCVFERERDGNCFHPVNVCVRDRW